MKKGVIIQARTRSTRFPKKILKSLPYKSSLTVLDQIIRRVKLSECIDEIIIATTINPEDNEIVDAAKRNNVHVFRGSEEDVLARYYHAAVSRELDLVVRITSDCPCMDWNIIDTMIKKFEIGTYDYLSNTLQRTFPRGLDVEIFSFNALTEAFKKAEDQDFREHVSPYIYKTNDFRTGNFEASPSCFAPNIRITLDTLADYALICSVYDYLYENNPNFICSDIVKLFKEKSWLYFINQDVVHKKILMSLAEEVKEAIRILELQDLAKAKEFLDVSFRKHSNK
ncbi:MAG: glycosyltransferase family protein [Candidatus Heimdallarchaeota archaeon]|nr:MAG: glycosyltransferase family protein [Candidatus Heimdallarchaeota archaeon]